MSINGGCLFMKILITGFEPFGGDAVNPSSEAVGLLPDQIDGTDIIKKVLPVVFGDAADQLTEMIRETVPDAVICTGLAAGRKGITPELIAVNIRDARIPDNAGRQPEWEKILSDGPDGLFSTLPIREMTKAMSAAGIPAEISKSAGTYVCNEVMYRLLSFCRKEYPGMRAGFIHLPSTAEYLRPAEGEDIQPTEPAAQAENALPLARIAQGLEICIRETIPVTLVRQDIPQAEKIYEEHLVRDFPEDEVKPFSVIEEGMREGHYLVYAAVLGGDLVGYAFLETGECHASFESSQRQGRKIALLDYFAVVSGKRDQGIGSRIMQALAPEKTGFDYILVESERVTEDLEDEQKKERQRRIAFYERAGAKRSGVYTYLYGVWYDILIYSGKEIINTQEAFKLTDFMYHEMYPAYWFPKLVSIYTEET